MSLPRAPVPFSRLAGGSALTVEKIGCAAPFRLGDRRPGLSKRWRPFFLPAPALERLLDDRVGGGEPNRDVPPLASVYAAATPPRPQVVALPLPPWRRGRAGRPARRPGGVRGGARFATNIGATLGRSSRGRIAISAAGPAAGSRDRSRSPRTRVGKASRRKRPKALQRVQCASARNRARCRIAVRKSRVRLREHALLATRSAVLRTNRSRPWYLEATARV